MILIAATMALLLSYSKCLVPVVTDGLHCDASVPADGITIAFD